MKKFKVFLVLLLSVFFICGCATTKAVKQEYNKNKAQDDWDTGEEISTVGKGMGEDFYSIFILPFKNVFTGNIFKEYSSSSEEN